jgi:hypothetical protein
MIGIGSPVRPRVVPRALVARDGAPPPTDTLLFTRDE